MTIPLDCLAAFIITLIIGARKGNLFFFCDLFAGLVFFGFAV